MTPRETAAGPAASSHRRRGAWAAWVGAAVVVALGASGCHSLENAGPGRSLEVVATSDGADPARASAQLSARADRH